MFWYDGDLRTGSQLELEISDPALCYGATCFTTMRVYDRNLSHTLTSWSEHCQRLKKSIDTFNWQQPNWQQLERGVRRLSQHFPVLRPTIFPDGREWITGRALPSDLAQRQTVGITAWIARDSLYRRDLPLHKTGNYLSAYLARNQALTHRAQEAILVDARGNWLETSTGNLWGQLDSCWYTPSLESGILPGIARSRWLRDLRSRNIRVVENIWHPEFVVTLQAIGYSNCVVDYVPIVRTIDDNAEREYVLKHPYRSSSELKGGQR